MLVCQSILLQVCANDYCASLWPVKQWLAVRNILRLNVSDSAWLNYIFIWDILFPDFLSWLIIAYIFLFISLRNLWTLEYITIFIIVRNAFFPKYWHFTTLSSAWYHNYPHWFLQFPTLPDIFSFHIFPLLTLLCFST